MGDRHKCWKCRAAEVEVNAVDSIYRLNCNDCLNNRKEEYRLEWMSTTVNNMNGCQFCYDTFMSKKKSKVHKCTMVGVHQCGLCAYQLNSNKSFNVHFKVRHGSKESYLITRKGRKPFKCTICNKGFSQKEHFTVHFRSHSGEKPFECEKCKRAFSQKEHLKVHSRTHTGEKPFECEICRKVFSRIQHYEGHLRIHSGEKPFKCRFCKKTFSDSSNLTVHQRTHTGVKPFECRICTKEFVQSGDLKAHLRTHTGDKPFECKFCDKAFSDSSNLKVHTLRIHSK